MRSYSALLMVAAFMLLGCTSQQERARRSRFAFRELNLPMRVRNDRLRVHNDELRNDITRLEGGRAGSGQIAIDRFVLDQDQAAVEIADRFARAWSEDGKEETRSRLSSIELRFDEASENCNARAIAATTIQEAEAGCAEFLQIRAVINQIAAE